RDERTLDSIRPRPNPRTSITPCTPKCFRAFERLRINRPRRTFERAPIGQHKGHRLPRINHELADGFEIFPVQISRGPQDYLLRAGYRFNRASLGPCPPWSGGAVIEPHR